MPRSVTCKYRCTNGVITASAPQRVRGRGIPSAQTAVTLSTLFKLLTRHDPPHLGKTLKLDPVGHLLGIINVALGSRFGIGTGHADEQGINPCACRFHLRVEPI